MKSFVWLLAITYLRSKQNTRFINFISITSIVGITLGVAVLITVLSIMNGFQTELRERILGMTAHLTIFEENKLLTDWETLRETILPLSRTQGAAPNILKQALLSHGKEVKGVMVRGIVPELEKTVSKISQYVPDEQLNLLVPGSFNIIVGKHLADVLNIQPGSKVTLLIPQTGGGIVGSLPRLRRFEVVGIMEVGMHEYDSGLALINMDDASKLYQMKNQVSQLQIQIDDLFAVDEFQSKLGPVLPVEKDFFAVTWQHQHVNFFRAIQLEKRIMFIIVALIIAVAVFNIVSTMVMVVNEKRSAIAILRTQGATKGNILSLFFIQGCLIGLIGTFLGSLAGVLLAVNIDILVPAIESFFDVQFFPADVYYISVVPSKLILADLLSVAGFSLVCSILATLYPAWSSSRIQPAEVLRYEG